MTACSMFADVPEFVLVKTEDATAVTVTVSVKAANCSVMSIDVDCPRLTFTPVCFPSRNPGGLAAMSYGPPMRTFTTVKVPSPAVTPSYTAPVGV